MFHDSTVSLIIPALDEELSIGGVLGSLPSWVDDVIVVDNGSKDATADVAVRCGARVIHEPRRGYGAACLAGMAALGGSDVVVFMDSDGSDRPGQMDRLVAPIAEGTADLVVGSRCLGRAERGSMTVPQRLGNALACNLMRLCWGVRYTDLGPFRAIRYDALQRLVMDDRTFGWTIQMQIRAAKRGLRCIEVPVDYRRRVGQSKISGTLRGTVLAGTKIIMTILKERLESARTEEAAIDCERLIVFTRYPEPGRTKTRLIPKLGPQGAADLQRRMTAHALAQSDELVGRRDLRVEIRYAGGDRIKMGRLFGADRSYREQGDGDLGARMDRAIRDALIDGAATVVVIGSDCPGVTADLLDLAFEAARTSDVVIGPATDGGYYLIAMRQPLSAVFRRIDWGAERVFEQTLSRLRELDLTYHLLPPLADVDVSEDLEHWDRAQAPRRDATTPRLSVIIPTLNEEACIERALMSIANGPGAEIVVVDGGSNDGTIGIARRMGAKVITSAPGRARQMNAGAAASVGEHLLFLHADTQLPPEFATHVSEVLSSPSVAAGAFRLRIDAPGPSYRMVERLANIRSNRLQMPYGDQAFFVRAETFRRVRGFPDLPIMEDCAIVRRLRKVGRIEIAPAYAVTSARRWRSRGVWRTTLLNRACALAFGLGVSAQRIARWRRPLTAEPESSPKP